jgi:hypothetical protein
MTLDAPRVDWDAHLEPDADRCELHGVREPCGDCRDEARIARAEREYEDR